MGMMKKMLDELKGKKLYYTGWDCYDRKLLFIPDGKYDILGENGVFVSGQTMWEDGEVYGVLTGFLIKNIEVKDSQGCMWTFVN